jgi:hypothetical protein
MLLRLLAITHRHPVTSLLAYLMINRCQHALLHISQIEIS